MPELPGWRLTYSGKVRDLYQPVDARPTPALLMVASDRVSAFDHLLEPEIPGKGAVLTAMTRWWAETLGETAQFLPEAAPAEVADRAVVVHALDMLPIECVVRGRITGSGFAEYRETGAVGGIPLPAGLADGDALPEPVFTPAWKAPAGQHDENIDLAGVERLVGADAAAELQERSLALFARASRIAEAAGLVLADTKLEFGRLPSGQIVLADEILTADSSRYWDAEALAAGRVESFDKQIVRNWLLGERAAGRWDGESTPPALPPEIVGQTAARYRELFARLSAR